MATLEELFNSWVSAFLGCMGVRPTTLGMRARGDPGPLRQIGAGRSPSPRTVDRVPAFIGNYHGDSGGIRDPPQFSPQSKPSTSTGSTNRSRAMTENPEQQNGPPIRLLRMSQVRDRTGLSRSTIRRWVAQGFFPQPIKLGENVVGWIEAEIDAWIRERIADTRGGG
ncbi:helix-turn-helix transcriptional regulator [Candidatus Palauibacter sp.]|uniref:helix-turn-helix transcriptional regulator n=1 Tax=Candidatus Palauibacter sp. TaxID=3101350 RepID=UPI003B52CA22